MESIEKKQIVYFLSALETTDENIRLACGYRFQRITPEYILVYCEEIPENAVEIKADQIDALSRSDAEWLAKTNLTILNEFAEKHADSAKKSFADFMVELDQNIKKEIEKAEKEGVSE